MARSRTGSLAGNIVAGFTLLAVTVGVPVAMMQHEEAAREDAARIKPLDDHAYSPQRLKECAANDAKRAAQGKPAQLCWPDLVAH